MIGVTNVPLATINTLLAFRVPAHWPAPSTLPVVAYANANPMWRVGAVTDASEAILLYTRRMPKVV